MAVRNFFLSIPILAASLVAAGHPGPSTKADETPNVPSPNALHLSPRSVYNDPDRNKETFDKNLEFIESFGYNATDLGKIQKAYKELYGSSSYLAMLLSSYHRNNLNAFGSEEDSKYRLSAQDLTVIADKFILEAKSFSPITSKEYASAAARGIITELLYRNNGIRPLNTNQERRAFLKGTLNSRR